MTTTQRQQLMDRRKQLDENIQTQAAADITQQLSALDVIDQAKHIGFYWPVQGELNVKPFLLKCQQAGKTVYLPALSKTEPRLLDFYQFVSEEALQLNKFNIPEPAPNQAHFIAPEQLDVVIVPLVAVDHHNNRLGCGCGYYDTTFRFKIDQPSHSPWSIGVGYHWQRQTDIPVNDWDVPLNQVILANEGDQQ